jgi:hypothetical protein
MRGRITRALIAATVAAAVASTMGFTAVGPASAGLAGLHVANSPSACPFTHPLPGADDHTWPKPTTARARRPRQASPRP